MAKRIGGRPYKKRLLPGLGYPIPISDAAPAGTFVDDEGSGWLGHMHLAGIALAIAATGLAVTSAQARQVHNLDSGDLPVAAAAPATGSFGAGPTNRRALSSTSVQYLYQPDDLPVAAAPVALDDGHWAPPRPATPPTVLPPPADNDVLAWAIDEVYRWDAPVTIRPAVEWTPWADDSYAPQQAYALDDGSWWQSAIPSVTPHAPAPWRDGDEVPTPPATVGFDDGEWLPGAALAPPDYVLWATTDEIVPQAAAFGIDDGAWWQGAVSAAAPVLSPPWADGDEISSLVALALDDARPVAVPAAQAPRVPEPWRDGDEVERIGVDDDSARAPLAHAIAPPVLPAPWAPGDEVPTPAATLAFDEGEWLVGAGRADVDYVLWATTDEIVPAPGTAPPDEAYWWRAFSVPARAVALEQFDDSVVPPQPGPVYEENGWQAPAPVRMPAAILPTHDGDEIASIGAIGNDDGAALAPPLRAPIIAGAPWFDADEIASIGAIGNDDGAAPVPPAPARAATPAPWSDDDWTPPPAPALSDEDYWLQPLLYSIPRPPDLTVWTQPDELQGPCAACEAALAAAQAQIADLQAQILQLQADLAAALARPAGSGGGGDDVIIQAGAERKHWRTEAEEARKERIRRNNDAILALIGGLIGGNVKKDPP